MHANARLTPSGRLTMVPRIESGRAVFMSRRRWRSPRRRLQAVGPLAGRGARRARRPLQPTESLPHETAPDVTAQIAEFRQRLKVGRARIGVPRGVAPSRVHRVPVSWA